MTETQIAETARRAARVTPYTADDWTPVVEAWWAAGHDLDRLLAWIDNTPAVTPYLVVTSIASLNADGVVVPAFREPPRRPDRFTVWTQNALVVVLAVSLAATALAVAARAVIWALS